VLEHGDVERECTAHVLCDKLMAAALALNKESLTDCLLKANSRFRLIGLAFRPGSHYPRLPGHFFQLN
jgi:hypothetical protein